MPPKKKGSSMPRWLRHRALIASEAILLVGAVQELVQQRVAALPLPNWGKVLWTMASVLGMLGLLLFFLHPLAKSGVSKGHDVVQAIPLPLPTLLVHLLAYGGIFLLYAWVWKLPVW
jgi:hypothetical protein